MFTTIFDAVPDKVKLTLFYRRRKQKQTAPLHSSVQGCVNETKTPWPLAVIVTLTFGCITTTITCKNPQDRNRN